MEGTSAEDLSVMNFSFIDASTGSGREILISYNERIFIASCCSLISIFGTPGNSMVIVAVLLSRKLRTATNVFVVSLATADLLTNVFTLHSIVSIVSRGGWPWPNAPWLCVIGGFMIFTCTGTSIYTLAAIALNRLSRITQPLGRYRNMFKPLHLGIMVALTWLVPFVIFLTLPLVGVGGFGYDKQHGSCSDLDQHAKAEIFHRVQTIVFYPLPLVTISACYILIFRHVRLHFKKQRHTVERRKVKPAPSPDIFSNPLGRSSVKPDVEAAITSNKKSSRSKVITKNEVDVTKNLFLVVCAFVVFLSPFFIALFIPGGGSNRFSFYSSILVLANSSINPVIYARRHPQFREVLGCMIRCRYADISEPSGFLRWFLK